MSSVPSKAQWLAAAMLSAIAAWIAAVPAAPTPVDRALPAIAILLSILAFMAAARWGTAPMISLPLLIGIAAATSDPSLRILAYGLVVAGAMLLAALASLRDGLIPWWNAAVLTGLAVCLVHGVGLTGREVLPAAIAVISAVLVASVLSREGMVPPAAIALAVAAGVLDPFHPARASLTVPAVVAALWFLRRPRLAVAAAALVLALAAGWVPLAIVALLLASQVLATAASPGTAMVPLLPSRAAAIGAPLFFHPRFVRELARADLARAAAAVILVAASPFFRPQQAAIAVIAAAAAVTLGGRDSRGSSADLPAVMFVLSILLLFGWSGVTAAQFPLPFPLLIIAAAAGIALLPSLVRFSAAAGGLAAVGACALILLGNAPRVTEQTEGVALKGVQMHIMRPGSTGKELWLVLAGANLTAMKPGTVVGSVDVIDDAGHGWRRELRVGQLADWGAFRREERFLSSNVLPSNPAGAWVGFGERAFPAGSGRVHLQAARPIALVAVRAAPALPPESRLHVERLELPLP